MRMNRRNVLVGLGTIVAGGGGALATGAFSQAEASRTLKVNVVTGSSIADDLVDVLLKPGGYDSVGLDGGTPSEYFPKDDSQYDSYGSGEGASANDVSLIDNNVGIVIGTTDNKLPANSTVSYDPLFAVVNDGTSGGGDAYNVEFSLDSAMNSTFNFDGNYDSDGGATVSEGSFEEINVDVEPGDSSDTDGTLTITITESN